MNVKELKELLEGHRDDTLVKLGGWVESSTGVSRFAYGYAVLDNRHFMFDKDLNEKVTILIEMDT